MAVGQSRVRMVSTLLPSMPGTLQSERTAVDCGSVTHTAWQVGHQPSLALWLDISWASIMSIVAQMFERVYTMGFECAKCAALNWITARVYAGWSLVP